jgi:hypothetical protein
MFFPGLRALTQIIFFTRSEPFRPMLFLHGSITFGYWGGCQSGTIDLDAIGPYSSFRSGRLGFFLSIETRMMQAWAFTEERL